MKQTIRQVLDDMKDSQINLGSETARETIASLVSVALKDKGTYTEYGDSEIEEQEARATWVCDICGEDTSSVEYDYLGSGTNHLSCELKHESQEIEEIEMTGHDHGKVWPGTDAIQKQIYNEMTSDGLPEGGDAQAVLESHKLADEIVDNKGKWIYESPDGGKTVFRRPFSDYDPEKKEEIDWKTKEPTGRKFTEYNNGNWSNEDEG
jgi:hypothetical protein